jgi:Chitobiase/beta-hexosaminidase C-terminal domain
MMKKILKNLLFLLMAFTISFSLASNAYAVGDVLEVYFEPVTANFERNFNTNGNYDVDVKIRAINAAEDNIAKIAGVILDFDYDVSFFKGIPTIIDDNMNSNLMIDEFSVSTENIVNYKKVYSNPYYFDISEGSSATIFTLRFSVTTNSAVDGTTANFIFNDDGFGDDLELVHRNGSMESFTTKNGSYVIVKDSVAPNISAAPTSMTMTGASYQNVVLSVTGLANPTDFQHIKYTLDGSDPLLGVNVVTKTTHPTSITLTQNAVTTINFFVEDLDGNKSSTKTEIYTVNCKPVVSASPASQTLNISYNPAITLTAANLPNQSYLDFIKYTIDGSEPKGAGGITYLGPVALPENQFTTLRYYAQHTDGTQSDTEQDIYTVDTISPYVSSFTVEPLYAKAGTIVTVSFSVSETLAGNPGVQIGGQSAVLFSGAAQNYVYRRTVQGNEGEGLKTIQVNITDVAGNSASDSGNQIEYDFTVPTYIPVLISPPMAVTGEVVEIIFTASERLFSTTTVDIMGYAANMLDEIPLMDGEYSYTYRSPRLTGFENNWLIVVHGFDLAGNSSNSNDNWDLITAEGEDLFANPSLATANIEFDFIND